MGYTFSASCCCLAFSVHPHSRGVYHQHFDFQRFGIRFIPTRVGYTISRYRFPLQQLRFIPTRVGYTQSQLSSVHHSSGSSPLAWGILGSTPIISVIMSVHPHSRGVYLIERYLLHPEERFIPTRVGYTPTKRRLRALENGSSPLAWGIQRA